MIGESKSDSLPLQVQVTNLNAKIDAERQENKVLQGMTELMNIMKERNDLLDFITKRGLLEEFQQL